VDCKILKCLTILGENLTLKKSYLEGIETLEEITIPYTYWKTFKILTCAYKKINITTAKSISKGAFRDTQSIEEVIIPDNIKTIPESCFENCKNLKVFKISENVKTIKDFAFKYCENLEVEIPKTVKNIGADAFTGCKKVTYLD
jgi:aspartate ammonia-lyase